VIRCFCVRHRANVQELFKINLVLTRLEKIPTVEFCDYRYMAPLNYKPVKATPAQELDPGGTCEHFPPNLRGACRWWEAAVRAGEEWRATVGECKEAET
jgi:hypothetical protein